MDFPRWSSQLIDPSDVGQLTLWLTDAMNRFQELEEKNKKLEETVDRLVDLR